MKSKSSYPDVTRPVRERRALEIAERYFDAVFDKAPVMLHSIGGGGRLVKVNSLWLTTLGYNERAAIPGIRVLYMSGYSEEALGRGQFIGCRDALIDKPFTPGELARRVREVLDS